MTAKASLALAAFGPLFGFAFLVQPALTTALCAMFVYTMQHRDQNGLWIVLFLMVAYLSLVNLTKLPESDLENYLQSFEATQNLDFAAYLNLHPRDSVYYAGIYGLSRLSIVDAKFYLFLSTLVPYLIAGWSIITISRVLNASHRFTLSVLIFLLFMPPLFSLSGHILRQMLAAAFIVAFIAVYSVSGRRSWVLGLAAMIVHISAIPLLAATFAPRVRALNRLSNAIILLFGAIFVYFGFMNVAPNFVNLPLLGVVFQRLMSGEWYQLNPLSLQALITSFLILGASVVALAAPGNKLSGFQAWPWMLVSVFISAASIVTYYQPALSELSVRYFFYLYLLAPILLLFLGAQWSFLKTATHFVALAVVPLWVLNLEHGVWSYAPVASLMTSPAWVLWTY